ncbi:MAG: hypothetical protein H6613_05600 [Ignavibacteriales bacterium]|nr:hypothetical protein [Ignavibacteriales bacterium]
MKETIKNMINFESITRMRSSVNPDSFLSEKNSLVSLIPLEYYKNSAKVLINGKLFFAQIEENVPIKEELVALVVESNPFTLSLNFTNYFKKNRSILLDQIIERINITNNDANKELLTQLIKEELPIIKSKFLQLEKLTKKIKVKDLELSLLINLVWKYSENDSYTIYELYENLFSLSFNMVCKNLFNEIKEILLTQEDNYLLNEINLNLIYDEKQINTKVFQSKNEIIINLVKYLSETKISSKNIENFIKYSTMYIMQKSVLKDYDYHPDFVIIKKRGELSLIKYNAKKMYLTNGMPAYKLEYEVDNLPIKLNAYMRNNFLIGNIDAINNDSKTIQKEVETLKENLSTKWQINSEINMSEEDIYLTENSRHKSGINKLVS